MKKSTVHNLKKHFELNYYLYIGFVLLMLYAAITNDDPRHFGLYGYKHNFIVFIIIIWYIHNFQKLDSRNGYHES